MYTMIPENFYKIVKDFILDLFGTFPELNQNKILVDISNNVQEQYQPIYDHIMSSFPTHFMSILNENESMFTEDCFLLPEVNFKTLWSDNITDKTKKIIWKYLKLILFVVMGNDPTMLDMFQNENLQDKMKDTIEEMKTLFEKDSPDIHKHLEGMMDGKIGLLAKEIAEETVGSEPQEEMIKNMMSDPSKMFKLMNSVGDKITNKIKSGQLKESELIEEATQMLQNMKNMPGMKQFESMFNQFGMPPNVNQHLKKAKTKDRLRAKLANREANSKK